MFSPGTDRQARWRRWSVGVSHAQRKALGDFGERVACRHLVSGGMCIVDRNWRCAAGEIDIIAVDGDAVVICEVKTRRDTRFGTPVEAITVAKANRLYRLGLLWLSEHDIHGLPLRVDVVSVLLDRRGAAKVEHLVRVL
jgi:putative endonuclease